MSAVTIQTIQNHGTIVQMVGKWEETGKIAVINWDHRNFWDFAGANPNLTLPFRGDLDDENDPPVFEVLE